MDIYLLLFDFIAVTPVSFQKYPGITLRGGIGMSMKRSLCVMGKGRDNCRECILSGTCAFARVFESVSDNNDERMKKATNYPHPFVLTPLFEGPVTFKEGDRFRLSLAVVGNGVKYLPYIVHSLLKLGENGAGKERGKFRLSGVLHGGDNSLLCTDAADMDYSRLKPVVFDKPEPSGKVEIEFRTPCRIQKDGKAVRNAEFPDIIKSIVRKMDNLGALYCNGPLLADRDDIVQRASEIRKVSEQLNWEEMSRYSKRQGNRMPLEGFTGRAVYEGDITPFHEILRSAEFINIGKNSSFGFGAVKVRFN